MPILYTIVQFFTRRWGDAGRVSLPSVFLARVHPLRSDTKKCTLTLHQIALSANFRPRRSVSGSEHTREHVATSSALAPPIAGASANSGALPLCPPGSVKSALKQCLSHLRYARASFLRFLPFTLHALPFARLETFRLP